MRNPNVKNMDMSIMVVSWDGAKQLWEPFATAMAKFWPDCPFETILLTQSIQPSNKIFDRVITIPSLNQEPVLRIRDAITFHIHTEYVLLICDDYFIYKDVSTSLIKDFIQIMRDRDIDLLHLFSYKRNHQKPVIKKEINRQFQIQNSLPCIYRMSMLKELSSIFQTCSMREFEVRASSYVNSLKKYEIFFSYSNAIPCLHCVLEGYWRWYPYLWCKKNGIRLTFDTYKRPHLIRTIYSVVKAVLFNIVLKYLPETYRKYSEKKYGKGISI